MIRGQFRSKFARSESDRLAASRMTPALPSSRPARPWPVLLGFRLKFDCFAVISRVLRGPFDRRSLPSLRQQCVGRHRHSYEKTSRYGSLIRDRGVDQPARGTSTALRDAVEMSKSDVRIQETRGGMADDERPEQLRDHSDHANGRTTEVSQTEAIEPRATR